MSSTSLQNPLTLRKVAYQKWQDSRTPSLFTRLRHPKSHQVLAAQTEKQAVHEYEKYFNEGQALSTRVERDTAAVAALVEQVESLEIMARHRDMLREELLAMYDRVFAGPTPAYPHEDAAEDSMTVAAIEAVTVSTALPALTRRPETSAIFRQEQ